MVWEDPDIVVDISETIEFKIAALACHVSGMPKPGRARHERARAGCASGSAQGLPLRRGLCLPDGRRRLSNCDPSAMTAAPRLGSGVLYLRGRIRPWAGTRAQ